MKTKCVFCGQLVGNCVVDCIRSLVICPGCCWSGVMIDLGESNGCPMCGYENNVEPFRLLTLGEIVQNQYNDYNDVMLGKFIVSVIEMMKERNLI